MIIAAEKKPALLSTFNATNGVAATAYPWTDSDDIRPQVDGVDQQYIVSGSSVWDLSTNRLRNRGSVGADTLVGIDLGARAKRILLNVENDESTAVASGVGVILHGSADLSSYIRAYVNRTIGGAFQFQFQVTGGTGTANTAITPATGLGTNQALEVIDDGASITMTYSGNSYTFPYTIPEGQTLVGVYIDGSSTADKQFADNLIAWT